jgi:alpha-tubulin suppressor-like RCC1 family protein
VAGGLRFRQVTSPSNSCGVTIGNLAYCWGGNAAGQLGDGTTNPSPTPVLVAGGLHFREVSGGVAHFCGVTTGNQAYCWGLNTFGPLGDGTSGNFRTVPVAVAGGLRFGEVRADAQHTCGIATDNAAYCWGLNVFGEAGDGTSDNFRPAPVAVVGGLRFRELTLGEQHTCGLVTGGRAFCWGGDFNFQLGTPTPGDGTTPVAVAGGLRFHQLSAGGDHTCAVSTGNAAYCWGTGFSGELGNGTTDPSQTPGPVAPPAP